MATNPTTLTGQQPTQAPQDQLTDELKKRLWWLLNELQRNDEIPRREEVRDILKRRLFFRGQQYWFWNDDIGCYMPPDQAPLGLNENSPAPSFQHVTNIFQAYASSLCSVISQNNTAARFWPEKPSDPADIQTAKNGSKAIDLIHRQNDWQNRVDEATYYMCTDGFIGGFVRYVSDAERFGTNEQHIYGTQETTIGYPMVECPQCGYADMDSTENQPTCPDCGAPLQDVPPETAQIPQHLGTIQIPKGQEVISIVPALQLRRTMYSDNQPDFLYMDWVTDIDKAVAMSTYPEVADAINGSAGGDSDGGTANTYERIARRILYLGSGRYTGVALTDLGTFHRAWIRPKAFYRIEGHDDNEPTPCTRCQLQQLFPNGVHVVFFNDVFCEAKNESMDEKWESMHTMPGEGQLRETLVSSIVPIQEQLNDAINLLFEICMYNVPEGFADTELLDFEARGEQAAQAGNVTPVKLAPNQNIAQKLMFTPAAEPSMAMMKYIEMLFSSIPQFLTGAFPALFGGDTGANDTASGIAIQRNQALGRIGRAWRRLQVFLCNLDGKAVKCFAKNRTEDVEIPKLGQTGDYESDTLRLEDLKGNVTAYPEVDAQYPTLEADVRSLVLNLWNGMNPIFMSVAQVPENLETIFRYMGTQGIEVPGEDQRKKTYKDIQQLTQGQPVPTQQLNPQTGQPVLVPSVQPDPDVDNLQVAADTAKKWLISDTGLQMRDENPAAYQNVKLYAQACAQLQKQHELQQAIAGQALQGQGPAADLGGAEAMVPPPHQKPEAPASPASKGAASEGEQ